jgi:hypothetical protein
VLLNEIFSKIAARGESEFSIKELFPYDWDRFSIEEKRSGGRMAFNSIRRGQLNTGGWVIEILPNTNPQRYRKRRELPQRVFLNEIPDIANTAFGDLLLVLNASGKWLEIVDKPDVGHHQEGEV